ncbi:hypothetical protein [Nonomuraea typhae]|uniref:Twin-arginine translocation signal domain-containing protein n=1 Tax=Nonomuraea typhae TaxID=2603600 RepID=A0ABW7YN32_9ACTN
MGEERRRVFSRRGVLKAGALAVTTVTASAFVADEANASTSAEQADVARVTQSSGTTISATTERAGHTFENVSLHGFPEGVSPRIGDLVTITDRIQEVGLAAFPLCAWSKGVPLRDANGRVSIAGRLTSNSSQLAASWTTGKPVRVCLLSTTLPDSQILDVRAV